MIWDICTHFTQEIVYLAIYSQTNNLLILLRFFIINWSNIAIFTKPIVTFKNNIFVN